MAVCAVAVYTDLRRRLIYNWLTLPATLVGIVLGFALDGGPGGLQALGGAVVAAILFGLFGLLGWMKFGDVKLMIAVGAFTRFPLVLWAIAYTAIVGGLVGVGYAIYRRRFGEVMGNLGRAAVNKVRRGDQPALRDLSQLTLPYGVAIAIGALWAVLTRYLPVLRLG
ncbi:MAG: prepilin peptidase [Deltaproteobacteria bacterium]|nr:prepilin peptidase [Deltaproteobacteria bacterium]